MSQRKRMLISREEYQQYKYDNPTPGDWALYALAQVMFGAVTVYAILGFFR